MSHVDDGMLHAYLDGGLSALDAVRVERHVADCAPCRERLDGARALIQRAARLLDWASPPAERAAPPLADLRPVLEPRWRVPVAWAATIVIALGAGLYGGRMLLQNKSEDAAGSLSSRDALADQRAAPIVAATPDSQPPQQLAQVPSPPAAAEPDRLAESTPTPAATGAGAVALRDSMTALSRSAEVAAAKTRTDTAAARARVDSNALAALNARREGAQNVAPAAPVSGAGAPAGARDSGRVQTSDAVAERRAIAPAPVAAPAVPSSGFNFRADGAVTASITADSARVLLGAAPVSLPDYPVSAIRVRDGVVTVEQVIPPGRVLRLVQRRAAAAEEQERAGGAANELLARYIGGLRVEISGPMLPDSLSRLLERARAMP